MDEHKPPQIKFSEEEMTVIAVMAEKEQAAFGIPPEGSTDPMINHLFEKLQALKMITRVPREGDPWMYWMMTAAGREKAKQILG